MDGWKTSFLLGMRVFRGWEVQWWTISRSVWVEILQKQTSGIRADGLFRCNLWKFDVLSGGFRKLGGFEAMIQWFSNLSQFLFSNFADRRISMSMYIILHITYIYIYTYCYRLCRRHLPTPLCVLRQKSMDRFSICLNLESELMRKVWFFCRQSCSF